MLFILDVDRHSPHGECGLKLKELGVEDAEALSLPAWGVWIEIIILFQKNRKVLSLPAWGVWIEIVKDFESLIEQTVTPRMGSVD